MKKISISFICAMVFFYNCTETTEGFLDSKGQESDDKASVFADSAKTIGFHAALFWQVGRVTMSPHNNSSNLSNYKDYEGGTDNSRVSYFRVTEFTPAYTKGDFSQGGTNAAFDDFRRAWQEAYQTIFRCNSFLESYQDAPLSQEKKDRLAMEARFIRSFFYYHLLRQYGGVPLIYDEVLDPYSPTKLDRNTFEEVVDYIAGELEVCATHLPEEYDAADYGRPTKGAALGLLTELYTLAASPLFNGRNIGEGNNRLLVGYDDFQVSRWQKVVDAAERMIKLGTHELVVDNDTRAGNGFYLATTKRVSKERVWFWLTVNTSFFPHRWLIPSSRGGQTNHIYPYHELTTAFPMKNGLAITDSNSEYDPADPYTDRDPRFGYTIIHNRAKWVKIKNGTPEEVYTYRGATQDGYGVPSGSPTGYYFRKCCSEGLTGGDRESEGQGLSFIRYSSILLFYAEALTELDVNKNRNKIEEQLFAIRDRAGIDAGDDDRYGVPVDMDKDKMIEFILNERRIELANECGNRFWDLKRRKTYEKLDGVWSSAAVWEKINDHTYTWSIAPIEQHFFSQRMYFSAIPQREINASHGRLIQNPGW